VREGDKKFIVALVAAAEIGPARLRLMADKFNSFEDAWKASNSELTKKTGFGHDLATKIEEIKNKIDPEKEWDLLGKNQISLLTPNDRQFPKQLKQIGSAPFVLFCQGNVDLLKTKQLAVVGTRIPSHYGKTATQKIVDQLVQAGLTITSGMAHGIDSIAHKASIESGGKTIAVLGAGIVENAKNPVAREIAEKIIENGGLVISEYHPFARATKFTFPARNRIIAGLSKGVLVVEAGEKSGSLITANLALENNREVFAVPGSIFSQNSLGTNSLLRQGAQLTASANDVLGVLGFQLPERNEDEIEFENELEKKIYKYLSYEPVHIDKISKKIHLSPSEISALLSVMELRNLIKNVGGGMFIRK